MRLLDHFLIAMPTLQEPCFKKSVVYLCEHSDQGAMGIVINQPLTLTVPALLKQLKIDVPGTVLHHPVFNGGPVAHDRGFILHTPQDGFASSLPISTEIMLTNSRDILEALGTEQQPQNLLLALGCANWQQDQLEQEITQASWLITQADPETIFHMPISQRWSTLLKRLGIENAWQIAPQPGHA